MRPTFQLLTALVLILQMGAQGLAQEATDTATRFPYDAYVVRDHASVQSGPGEDYYRTSLLPQGSRVTVYQHAPGGWVAIQPPADSFCWVSSDRVWRTADAKIGEVIGEGAVSWIGSAVDNVVEHRWQVQLRHGELVELLGEKQTTRIDQRGESVWYRIAPPSGEFRWIRDIDILRDRVDPTDSPDGPPRHADTVDGLVHPLVRPVAWNDEGSSTNRARTSERSPRSSMPAPRVASLAPREPDRIRDLDDRTSGKSPATSVWARDEIGRVEVEMALMVAKDPSFWDFGVLRERLQKVIDKGTTPVDRGRARLVMERLDEFENIRKRQVKVNQGIAEPSAESKATSVGSSEPPVEEEKSRLKKLEFDGTGIMRTTASRDPKAPRFALTDEDGHIEFLLVPAPGVNLRLYELKQVGIRGRRAGEYRAARDPSHPLPVFVVENVIRMGGSGERGMGNGER